MPGDPDALSSDNGRRWIPLADAVGLIGPTPAQWRSLVDQGRLFLGRAPTGLLMVHAACLDALVEELSRAAAREALAETVPTWQVGDPGSEPGLTLGEAAALLHVSPKTLRAAIARGRLVGERMGGRPRSPYRLRVSDVQTWAQQRRLDSTAVLEAAKRHLEPQRRPQAAQKRHRHPHGDRS